MIARWWRRYWPCRASRAATDEAITTAQGVRQRLDAMTATRRREAAATRLEQIHIRRDIIASVRDRIVPPPAKDGAK